MDRVRIWDKRSQAANSFDRNLRQAFNEMKMFAEKLAVRDEVIERAAYIYRKAVERGVTRGRSIIQISAAALYAAIASFIQDYKKKESERVGFSTVKDSEVLHLLVFLARLARNWTNGRPRARIYLQFLRGQFPQQDLQREASRIIAP